MIFFALAVSCVQKIPLGRVATYGQIAALCGSPRSARTVGWALHNLSASAEIPARRRWDAGGSDKGRRTGFCQGASADFARGSRRITRRSFSAGGYRNIGRTSVRRASSDIELARTPWHRVVNREGRISTTCLDHPAQFQALLLKKEGIAVEYRDGNYFVDLKKYLWRPELSSRA